MCDVEARLARAAGWDRRFFISSGQDAATTADGDRAAQVVTCQGTGPQMHPLLPQQDSVPCFPTESIWRGKYSPAPGSLLTSVAIYP